MSLPALAQADFVFHLAGVNRPQDPAEFATGNAGLTQTVCTALVASGRCATVYVCRLPNVFGKWAQPNYNSAVATFCHNMTRGFPISVNDPAAPLTLVYVDDVLDCFVRLLDERLHCADLSCAARSGIQGAGGHGLRIRSAMTEETQSVAAVAPQYSTTVGEVAQILQSFADSRSTLLTPPVGTGLVRALYSTYISYLPPEKFAYPLTQHADPRGVFVEVLKTPDCGQFSFFTAHPGVTRGGHYHHSKTEKFLVIKGQARFKFRHMQTGQTHELCTSGDKPEVVETVPGWTHDITNIGTDEMIVMLWANEVFDRDRPDTFACPL